MKYLVVLALLLVAVSSANAQVSSHTPTKAVQPTPAAKAAPNSSFNVSDKAVAKVNGAVLTDRDLLREMLQIFPYAGQHNGFPKDQEANIRQGALQMIIFEELVYQEAQRRKLTVPDAELNKDLAAFKSQFHSKEEYDAYVKTEMGGNEENVKNKIKRSLLIDKLLKSEVGGKSAVSLVEEKAYYDKNPAKFQLAETYEFKSISFLPPANASAAQKQEATKRANDALKQAKAAKSAQEFGLLAEKISEDDFRVNMGQHKPTSPKDLPPQVLKALQGMKPGQVSDLIPIEAAYTIVFLDAHTQSRKVTFDEVKATLKPELQKAKYEKLRVNLDKTLRANAKVEIL